MNNFLMKKYDFLPSLVADKKCNLYKMETQNTMRMREGKTGLVTQDFQLVNALDIKKKCLKLMR